MQAEITAIIWLLSAIVAKAADVSNSDVLLNDQHQIQSKQLDCLHQCLQDSQNFLSTIDQQLKTDRQIITRSRPGLKLLCHVSLLLSSLNVPTGTLMTDISSIAGCRYNVIQSTLIAIDDRFGNLLDAWQNGLVALDIHRNDTALFVEDLSGSLKNLILNVHKNLHASNAIVGKLIGSAVNSIVCSVRNLLPAFTEVQRAVSSRNTTCQAEELCIVPLIASHTLQTVLAIMRAIFVQFDNRTTPLLQDLQVGVLRSFGGVTMHLSQITMELIGMAAKNNPSSTLDITLSLDALSDRFDASLAVVVKSLAGLGITLPMHRIADLQVSADLDRYVRQMQTSLQSLREFNGDLIGETGATIQVNGTEFGSKLESSNDLVIAVLNDVLHLPLANMSTDELQQSWKNLNVAIHQMCVAERVLRVFVEGMLKSDPNGLDAMCLRAVMRNASRLRHVITSELRAVFREMCRCTSDGCRLDILPLHIRRIAESIRLIKEQWIIDI